MTTASTPDAGARRVTLRCPFCLTRNRVDMRRAGHRPACGSCGRPLLLDRPVKVAEEDFDATVLEAEVPVLVDFHADWCAPCRVVAPALDALAGQTTGRLLVVKVDTDRAPALSARYEIRSIPTLLLIRDGRIEERITGVDPSALQRIAQAV